jgi:ABC-2 type transport system permease protein
MSSLVASGPGPSTLRSGHYGAMGQVRSEWTKFRTLRSTTLTLAIGALLVIGIGALTTWVTADHWNNAGFADKINFDPTRRSLAGVYLDMIAIGVLGVLVMSGEYATGTIRATLSAIPNRPLVLACKAAVFGAIALISSEVITFVAFFIGQLLLRGTTPYATLGQPNVLRAVAGTGLTLAVMGLFGLGLATIIRHTAGAISAYVAVLLILPLILQAFPASVENAVIKYTPLVIGVNMTATKRVIDFGGGQPFSPWAGFAILCGYTAAVLFIGGVLLVRRDA